tara:strand:+ start:2380 stop:2829 length:450 start_codon:yes stop_codon:yes gene_type:complete
MANLIIKPASASDTLKMQDGAGTDIVTVSTNKVAYGKGISEEAVTVTQGSGTVTLDLAQGNFFEFTLTENVTGWTFSNLASSGTASSWIIKITQHASSAKTVAYPAAVKWSGGYDHVMSTGTGSIDIVSMFTIDGGTTIYANIVGKAFA